MKAKDHPVETLPAKRRVISPWHISNIIDRYALREKLSTAALSNVGKPEQARKEALEHLHAALFRGRMIAQDRLNEGADGLDTARLLSAVMDEVLSALYEYTESYVFPVGNRTDGQKLSVLATGGYGRGVLAPSSDVDLLFIRPHKTSAHAESVIEFMLYALWDIGLKVGHAFRTPQECIRLSKTDVTIKTSILDARFLFGDEDLGRQTLEQFSKQVVAGQDSQFIADKLEERDRRHSRQGNTRYVVEPNIKESKGGLRDLQTLFWLVKHIHIDQATTLEEVMKTQVFTKHEYHVFIRAARFLWTLRCHLHFLTGRPEERLSFDLQPELAHRMGYRDRKGQLGVERFMKRYFLAAKDVGGLTRILTAKLEAERKAMPLNWRNFLPSGGAPELKDTVFDDENGRIIINDNDQFLSQPANLIQLFKFADELDLDIHPRAMSLVARNIRKINRDTRSDPDLIDTFLGVLINGKNPGLTLSRLNEAGVLGRFLPEFGGIVGQTQFNMYHHYTVDEHTLRAVKHIAKMERGEEGFELATGLFPKLENRRALYLAMLLHDTGKGLGDQQIEGMKTATSAGERLGLPQAEIELIAWLVGNHLEMSETAQKRDISDPKTVANFSSLVGDLERLRLLYILTVADIRAVGPNIWNTWKKQLLAELYHSTAASLRGGRTDEVSIARDLNNKAEENRAAVIEQLGAIPPAQLELEDAYWSGFDLAALIEHGRVLSDQADTIVRLTVNAQSGGTELFVSGTDRIGLFARLAAAIDIAGANIVSAQVFTGKSGRILDVFLLQDEMGQPYAAGDAFRLEKLEAAALEALTGTDPIERPKLRPNAREAAFVIEPTVIISSDESANHTVIDVAGRDRPGFVTEVATVLAQEDISILSAHVGSYGERVFDAFYVSLPSDFDAAAKAALRERIIDALMKQEPEGPSTPALKLKRASAADSF